MEQGLPKFPLRFLRWYCKQEVVDEIEGDLIEAFRERYETDPSRAKMKFTKEVIQSFNRRNIGFMEKYRNRTFMNQWAMIQQYGKVLLRNMQKSRIYTAISIASLALGITCAGLIYLYLQKELTFDQVYTQSENIYRISHLSHNSGRSYAFAPFGMVPQLISSMDAVEDGVRIFQYRRAIPMTSSRTQQAFNEPRFGWTDPSFFDVFDLPLLQGARNSLLERPNTVVISASTARKYFGDENPMGEVIIFNWDEPTNLEVVGVFQDFPSNSSFQLDLISNFETCYKTMWSSGWVRAWNSMIVNAYIVIKPGGEEDVLNEAQRLTSKYYTPEKPKAWETSFQKLTNIHLDPPKDIGELSKHNDQETITLFATIGIIILSLGAFNFTNMITAQAGQRTKEVGVRKVLGSRKKQIAYQTFFETLVFVFIAGLLSLGLMYGMLPKLRALTGHDYFGLELISIDFLLPFISVLIGLALLAGIYPALVISRIQSLQLMRKIVGRSGNHVIRNILVTAQFTIISGLIICTAMIYLQLQYLQSKDVGFDESLIVNMPIHSDDAVIPKINAFRNEVTSYNGISHVTAASHEMFSDYTYITNFKVDGFDDLQKWERYTVEQDYVNAFDLEIIAGRGFERSIASDSNAFVLNEKCRQSIRELLPEEVIGLTITDDGLDISGKIVGVVKDFHFRSLHHTIQPFVMYVNWDRLDYISVRMSPENFMDNLTRLEAGWYKVFGEAVPFFASFLDQQAAALYESEDNERQLFTLFSMVSILLGCLGLFGSALFTTERRFKEIGLRKVLGAGTWQLILLINQNFIRILVLALFIAIPIAFLLINNWLDAFAYRISQPIWVYGATGILTFGIATLTVSYLSWKAASSNPVDAIKME